MAIFLLCEQLVYHLSYTSYIVCVEFPLLFVFNLITTKAHGLSMLICNHERIEFTLYKDTIIVLTLTNIFCPLTYFVCFYDDIAGGKKNRQKERRLMKGFNLAPPGTPGINTLPPVAEFMSSFHQSAEGNDYYSYPAFSNLVNTSITPRRNHMYSMQQFSSSQSSFSESFGNIGRLGKIGSKLRNNSQKRRWGKYPFASTSFAPNLFRN